MSGTAKKLALSFLAAVMLPVVAYATASSVDRVTNHIEPLIKTDYVKAAYFTASTTNASTLPYASTTALSGTSLCIGSDCRSVWPASGAPGTVSTSSTPTIGQLAYWTSTAYPSLLGTIATTTHSFSGPFTVTGTIGALVGGTNSTITWNGLATTSQPSSSNVLVSNGTSGVYGVATSSVSFSGPFTVPTTLGKLVGGSGSITWYGLSTTSAISSGQVLYGTSASGVASVATSTLAVGTSLSSSGTLGYQIGGSATTLSLNTANSNTWSVLQTFNYSSSTAYSSFASASSTNWLGGGLTTCTGTNFLQWSGGFYSCAASPVSGSAAVSTSSSETSSQLAYWTTTSGTPAKLGTVATTTLSVSGPLGITAARGTLVGGSNATISWSGLATTTAISSGQVLYGTSVSGVSSVATSSLAVGTGLSVSSGSLGFQIGGSNATVALTVPVVQTSGGTGATSIGANMLVTNNGSSVLVSSSTPTMAGFFATSTKATSTIAGNLILGTTANSGNLFDAFTLFQLSTSTNSYSQVAFQNTSSGNAASTDMIMCNNLSTRCTNYYLDEGINGGGYTQASDNSENAGDAFNIASDGAFVIGTASSTNTLAEIRFVTGGLASSTIRAEIKQNGQFGYGTTSPWGFFSVNAPYGGTNSLIFNVASSSPTATSSLFSISRNGTITLSASQPATSTTITLDWANTAPQVEYQIGTSATTITLINATTSFQWGSRKLVYVCNPGSTAGAVTWAGVEWIGSAPTQTTTANQCDVYSFDVTRATSTSAYKVAGTMGAGFQ